MKSPNAVPAISVALMIIFLFAPNANTGSSLPKLPVLYTSEAPIIDGKKEGLWSKSWAVKMEHYLYSEGKDKSDLSATFETLWDDTRFYCFVTVKDQDLVYIPDLPDWANDGVEIYFDGDNSKNEEWYDDNDEDLVFVLSRPPNSLWDHVTTDNVVYAYKPTKAGYDLEFSIPFTDLRFAPGNWHQFGFEVQINDNDSGNWQEDILKWWSTNDNTSWDPSLFGTALLIGKPTRCEELPVLYTSQPPVIDGKKDGLWSKSWAVKMKHYLYSSGTDRSDLSATFETLWDNTRFYCFITVKDQDLNNLPGLPDWENDGVEVYFDGDNSKNEGWYDGNDDQLRFELGDPPANGSGYGHINVGNIVYAYKTTGSGYNLEFSIPFSDLLFEPRNWRVFGFELQINDNDDGVLQDRLKWWSTCEDTWWNPSLFGTALLIGKPHELGKEAASTDISAPERFDLLPNYPNPFNPTTIIQYQLPVDATVEISIYNMQGQRTRSLVNELTAAGVHKVEWDGKDDFGKEVASGVYLYRMKAADYVMTRKLTLIR